MSDQLLCGCGCSISFIAAMGAYIYMRTTMQRDLRRDPPRPQPSRQPAARLVELHDPHSSPAE